MAKSYEKLLNTLALPTMVFAALLIVFMIINSSKSTGEQSNAYIRVTNCILSIPATTRTQSDIEACYRIVETELDTQLTRYDSTIR